MVAHPTSPQLTYWITSTVINSGKGEYPTVKGLCKISGKVDYFWHYVLRIRQPLTRPKHATSITNNELLVYLMRCCSQSGYGGIA